MEIFNNALFDVVLAALVFLFLGGGIVYFAQRRKTAPEDTVLKDILATLAMLRPQILELIADITMAYNAAEASYEALEMFVISEIHERIQALEFLSPAEKALITKDVLIAFLRPELQKLYAKKVVEAAEVK